MKFSKACIFAGLAAFVAAEDLLFVDTFQDHEFADANTMGFSTKVVTEDEFRAMSTIDFSKFKAIILSDPSCGLGVDSIQFLDDTKTTWSPAITGNIILIGTDPSFHYSSRPGAGTLIDNAIKFAAAGETTGLYFALSCYYGGVETSDVPALSEFGKFTVRGDLGCYNNAHIVASSPALGSLDDAALSNWGCSVHEAFSEYPTTGVNGFQALAIAKDIIGEGSKTFGDETIGLPYILSRGATPAACGDGKWDSALGEECDDGNTVSGDGCSLSCKCESGLPKGDGTCITPVVSSSSSIEISSSTSSNSSPAATSTSDSSSISTSISGSTSSCSTSSMPISGSSSRISDAHATSTFGPHPSSSNSIYYTLSSGIYGNSTTRNSPIYATSSISSSHLSIIGVEVIEVIEVIKYCSIIGTETITSYNTVACSTLNRPIYNHDKPGYPCYVCALSSEGYSCPTSSFITATTTSCTNSPPGYTHTPKPPTLQTCHTCAPITLSICPSIAPLPSNEPNYIVPAPSVVPHEHHDSNIVTDTGAPPVNHATTPSPAPYGTEYSPAYSSMPTGTYESNPVPYTGGAASRRNVVVGAMTGVVVLAAAILL